MRPTILVVDDSELLRKLIVRHLSTYDADVIECDGGREALELVSRRVPDLILLDIEMPEMSGLDVIAQLKDDPALYRVPVIFLTGTSDRAVKLKAFDLGATDYVIKPFDAAELKARVRTALRTKSLLDLLTTQAMLDGLTTLHNRRFFDERLSVELERCARHDRELGLMLLDIDRFKQINDRFGHPRGDEVIIATARVIKSVCRQTDMACRFGGDEFALILPETDAAGVDIMGQRLNAALREHSALQGLIPEPITFSIGGASTSQLIDADASGLVMLADGALYAVKQGGRNAFRLAVAA